MSVKLPDVSSPYGAPMGRRERHQAEPQATLKFSLRRIPINKGGYDHGGAYWGIGAPLYQYESEDGKTSAFLRAAHRNAAKAKIRQSYPNARFYR